MTKSIFLRFFACSFIACILFSVFWGFLFVFPLSKDYYYYLNYSRKSFDFSSDFELDKETVYELKDYRIIYVSSEYYIVSSESDAYVIHSDFLHVAFSLNDDPILCYWEDDQSISNNMSWMESIKKSGIDDVSINRSTLKLISPHIGRDVIISYVVEIVFLLLLVKLVLIYKADKK